MSISPSGISILIQGPLFNDGHLDVDVISNIERTVAVFQEAEIIVSTWKCTAGQHAELAQHRLFNRVHFLFNEDPGCIEKTINGITYHSNINRMLFSTLRGLTSARNDFVIKIRTDSYFFNNEIVSLINDVISKEDSTLKRDQEYRIFHNRVINCNLFARDAHGYLPFLYHPGDILLAGLKHDLISLFSVKPCSEEIFQPYYRLCFFSIMKLVPEQYLWVNCIKNKKQVDVLEKNRRPSSQDIHDSEAYYVNNFICYSSNELGFLWVKHRQKYHEKGRFSVYSHKDWLNLYRTYISHEKIVIDNDYRFKKAVTVLMKGYFFIRTSLLRIHFVRKIAIMLFVKRCC